MLCNISITFFIVNHIEPVLGGCAVIEKTAIDAGFEITVPFTPGRTDASQEWTDVDSFKYLEPIADGFHNYAKGDAAVCAEHLLVDKTNLLNLTVPEMTVLIGGLRALKANWDNSDYGVFTDRPEVLTNDFFVNLFDMKYEWKPVDDKKTKFELRDRKTGETKYKATKVGLIFGYNPELKAVSEFYTCDVTNKSLLKTL